MIIKTFGRLTLLTGLAILLMILLTSRVQAFDLIPKKSFELLSTTSIYTHWQSGYTNYESTSPSYQIPEADVDFSPSETATTYGIGVGLDISKYFSIEAGWKNFGNFEDKYEADAGLMESLQPIISEILLADLPADAKMLSATVTDRNEIKGLYGELIAKYPMGKLSIFGKWGYTKWRVHNRKSAQIDGVLLGFANTVMDLSGSDEIDNELYVNSEDKGGDTYYGAGLSYDFTKHLNLILSYEIFEFNTKQNINDRRQPELLIDTKIKMKHLNAGVNYTF